MALRYLKNIEIDKKKWDVCIKNSLNGLIYGYSWYLDCVAENWDALVEDDYISVLPLPWKQKYRIKYVYQPFFCQQLGVFSPNLITEELWHLFIKSIPLKFLVVNMSINSSNKIDVSSRKNYLLKLDKSYHELHSNYDANHKKNITKAQKNGLSISNTVGILELISNFRIAYGKLNDTIKETDYHRLAKLIGEGIAHNQATIYSVLDANREVVASGLFMNSNNRYYYLLGAPTQKGRESRAIYFLIDAFIKSHCESEQMLDFEGSEIPNVAYFYKNFGAIPEYYFPLKINRLKFWEKTK